MYVLKAFRILACTALVGAAITAHAQESGDSLQALQESLVSWSASDFADHGPHPEEVRNVHVRYAEKDSGERSYMLCGQFLPTGGDSASWTQFSTVKTDPYEQWIGGQAESLCERALPLSAGADDLSSVLQSRLNDSPASTTQPYIGVLGIRGGRLTIHSSRNRFAVRFNSGARPT